MANKRAVFKSLQKKRAKEHINNLFIEQQAQLNKDIVLAQRYTDMIRKLSMAFRLKLPREVKRSFCKHCYAVFPASGRVRLHKGKVIKFCEKCKNFTRIPYR